MACAPFRVDCPSTAYAEIVKQHPEARALVDQLLSDIASRVANVAQILSLNAEEWKPLAEANGDRDEETMRTLLGLAQALGWVRDEIGVLTGSGLGRAAQIPAFANPACWCDLVPPDEEEDRTCSLCQGTGIGQHGDPDTSRCSACRGTGEVGP